MAGVEAGKLSGYLDGYSFRVCKEAGELSDQVSRRESLLKSVQVGKRDSGEDDGFRLRVERWKGLALGFLAEIYTLRRAIGLINDRYFDGQQIVFPAAAEGFNDLLALAEKTVGIYNDALAGDIERLDMLLNENGDRQDEPPLTIDLAGLMENVQGAAKEQVAYMVDLAKADALDLLGESRQGLSW